MNYPTRILSIDVVRGLVMILMALDHTRHFLYGELVNQNDGLHDVWLFFARFITNFCAPAFLMLAGFSIYLSSHTFTRKKEQSLFLIKRGLILILLELTLMNFFWDTSLFYIEFQILWVFGLSFIVMAIFIHLPKYINLGIGILLIVFQHLLESGSPGFQNSFPGAILYFPQYIDMKDTLQIQVLYTMIPWTAVMMLGYGMSEIFDIKSPQRQRILIWSGIAMILSFIILRSVNIYGDLHPWQTQSRERIFDIISFLDITKYPASLDFLLLSIGITFPLLASLDRINNDQFVQVRMLGNVSLFFYIIHIPFIRVLSKVYFFFFEQAPGPLGYLIFCVLIVLLLWWICKFYRQFKLVHKTDTRYLWLKYV